MTNPQRVVCALTAVLAVAAPPGSAWSAQQDGEDEKPSVSLRVTPPVGFSPLRIRASVELRGGSDDYEDFYCPEIEWEWGDGTVSESSQDCDPYEAGKSTITRRFRAEHVMRQSGGFRVTFNLKQRDRVMASATAVIQVRAGVGGGR